MTLRVGKLRRQTPIMGQSQLRWLIRLRWAAPVTLIVASLGDYYWLNWSAEPIRICLLGTGMLGWNALLWLAIRATAHWSGNRSALVMLALAQIIVDLACLTVLVLWTGGTTSPVLGFFVFHMVIASLLLRAQLAYAIAALSGLMLTVGLALVGQYPFGVSKSLILLGWMLTLVITVYLTSSITRMLYCWWRTSS